MAAKDVVFGGEARMTRVDHRTGTERIAEVAAHEEGDVFVNVQGDEPLVDPAAIDAAVAALLEEPAAQIATVATPIRHAGDITSMNVKAGDRVLFGKYSGQTVKVDGDELLVMREEDLFAVVEK